jgi:hypothetical protein
VVWEWDGVAWTKKEPVGDVPEPRQGHSMVYDEVRQRVLLFGGQTATATTCDGLTEVTCSTLWEWDGTSWRRVVPLDDEGDGNPPGRSLLLLTFDRARGETVLVSGDTRLFTPGADLNPTNDATLTWTWNGTSWRLASRVRQITTILGGASYYDPLRERVVAFGGKGPGDATAAVIEWDGVQWSAPRAVVDPEGDTQPIARQTPGAAYDEVNNIAVIFGGLLADRSTWLLRNTEGHSVAHQFDFAFAAAGAVSDEVTFVAVDVDNEIRSWLANPSSTLHLALRSPVGAAQLSTDAFAVTIRYRLP